MINLLLLLDSQNVLDSPDSTLGDNFSIWLVHTLQSSLENHTLESHNSYFFDIVVLYLCQGKGVAPPICIE